ncbi:hypothetical protein [Micromonospora saelicesensis]|uniref:hypothetical protein n=1 Tax=Micromonospora saelicesensis TaxID=285676 RepID=UPI000DC2E7FF|nr:hypothetical protein [Micromonospora saelicesensis]RAO50541.1 hypothetical protein PSN01_04515 [Micromonospora saelicesensis]
MTVSDSYPPPDPNVTPWSGPPAPQQGGYPPYGQPPPQPYYGTPPPPAPNRSNKGLIIGLVAGAVVVILAICGAGIGLLLAYDDDEPARGTSSTPTLGTGSTPGTGTAPTPGQADPPNNNSMTARFSSDLANVCEGSPILNAAPYSGPAGAKAYTFSNNPDRPTSWSSTYVPSDKSYYAKGADYQKVSVVGCLKFDEGSQGVPKKCQYKDKAEKQVTIDYVSSRYTLTFYAARTAEKIGDGGTVTAPTNRCPSFISYDKTTMRAYATPDSGTIEAALDTFLS